MSYTVKDLLEIALAEAGYLEKKSLSQLEDKTANAGSGNITKYARDLYNAGYYNGSKQGAPWCSVFVDWCHYMAAGKNKQLAQSVSCQSGVYGAGCTYSMRYYQAAGHFHTKDPQVGDQIYFGSGSTAEHTGIVYKVDESRVYTVEGNTSAQSGVVSNGGGVFQKSYLLSNKRILGYGRPHWAEEEDKAFSVSLSVLKKGSRGKQVKALQRLLIGCGCGCGKWGADGNFGAATQAAVCSYQKKNGITPNGTADAQTWKSLLGIA